MPQETRKFVGRGEELRLLTSFLARALDGEGGVCFVTGEAGAGKTALLGEFARIAQEVHPELVLAIGDCNAQTGIGDPYLPFREILGLLTGDVSGQLAQGGITDENAKRLSGLLAKSGQALIEHGPDLVDIFVPGGAILTRIGARAAEKLTWVDGLRKLTDKSSAVRGGGGSGTAGLEQHHIFEQYTNVLRSLATDNPLVLVLDDLHWADTASVGLLFHLSRRIKGDRILLLGAYRPEDLKVVRDSDRHPLEPVLSEVKRYQGDVWVRVGDQEEDEGLSLVESLLDAEPNQLGTTFREALFQKTKGHALFTVELLEAMKDRGTLVQGDDGRWEAMGELSWEELPARIEGVIEERTHRLTDEMREILSVASVEGEDFTAEVISGVLESGPKETIRVLSGPLQNRYDMVQARGMDRIGARRLSRYSFRHNLFQEFFYQALDPVERRFLHENVAEAMESLFREDLDRAAVWLAHHFEEAGEHERAVPYLMRAGRRAMEVFANADGETHLRRALRLMDESGPGGRKEALVRAEAHEMVGDLLERSGKHEAAREAYGQALELWGHGGLERGRVLRKMAKCWEEQREYEEGLRALSASEEAMEDPALDKGPEWRQEWVNIKVGRLWIYYWRGDSERMELLLDEIRPVAEAMGRPDQIARLFICQALIDYRRYRYRLPESTVALADQIYGAAEDSGARLLLAEGVFSRGFARLFHGDYEGAEEYLGEAAALANQAGDVIQESRAAIYQAVALRRLGLVDDVEELTHRTLAVHHAAEQAQYVGASQANLSWVAWRRGDLKRARLLAREAQAAWDDTALDYPVRWIGLIQLLAIELDDGEIGAAVKTAKRLLHPLQVRQGDELEEALTQAVGSWETDDLPGTEAHLRAAVSAAQADHLL